MKISSCNPVSTGRHVSCSSRSCIQRDRSDSQSLANGPQASDLVMRGSLSTITVVLFQKFSGTIDRQRREKSTRTSVVRIDPSDRTDPEARNTAPGYISLSTWPCCVYSDGSTELFVAAVCRSTIEQHSLSLRVLGVCESVREWVCLPRRAIHRAFASGSSRHGSMLLTGTERAAVLMLRLCSLMRSVGCLSGSIENGDEIRQDVRLPTLLLIMEDIQRKFVVE
jgi:hypothetical protein